MKKLMVTLLAAASVLGTSLANAGIIFRGEIAVTGNSSPANEIVNIEAAFPDLVPLTYLAKIDNPAMGSIGNDGPLTASVMATSNVNGAGEADYSWDFTGTGFELTVIAIKTARFLNIYEITGPDQIAGMGTFDAPDGKDSQSHASFFGQPGGPPVVGVSEPASLALLLLGLGVAGMRRRVR